MKSTLRLCLGVALAALAAAPLAGCSIYFGDDDDCAVPPIGGDGVRNPHNGACEPFNSGAGCGGVVVFEAPVAFDWGQCPSACEALDEQSCLASPECHATYTPCPATADCSSEWVFNECWDLPPSGGNYGGEQCEGLDAESCNRNADCASFYNEGDSGDSYPGGGGPLSYDSCAPEGGGPNPGCFSQADCPDGTVCTAETECLPPPCPPGQACPDVCFGHCVPSQNACEGVECGVGYHCAEICTTTCDPADPTCTTESCQATCVPDGGGGVCDTATCPAGQHCEPVCHPCDPLPGMMCPPDLCEATCVNDPAPSCENVDCPAGSHCDLECTADPAGQMHCAPVCVPDGNSCAGTTCAPGTHCVETCAPPPPGCMGGPMGCPPACTVACVPNNPGSCVGPVACDALPPACPMGTRPGILNGCWTGFCIPLAACELPPPPAACETFTNQMTCDAAAGCDSVFTATCTANPDGTFACGGFMFVRCQATPMVPSPVPPLPPMQ